MPSDECLTEIIDGLERKFGFPNCGVAIDGTHIPIIAPQHHHTDYSNRKGYYSIVAQVVCDHEYKVMSVTAGWPGRVHEARVFVNSSICRQGNAGTLFPHRPRRVGKVDLQARQRWNTVSTPAETCRESGSAGKATLEHCFHTGRDV